MFHDVWSTLLSRNLNYGRKHYNFSPPKTRYQSVSCSPWSSSVAGECDSPPRALTGRPPWPLSRTAAWAPAGSAGGGSSSHGPPLAGQSEHQLQLVLCSTYALSLGHLLALLPGDGLALLAGHLLTVLPRHVPAVLLLYRPTLLSGHLPGDFAAVGLGYVVTLSLSGRSAFLMRHFLTDGLLRLTDLSWYLGTTMT